MKTGDDLTTARKTCIAKYSVTGERIAEYRTRVFRETDPETPLYVTCVFEELGLWVDGGFVTDSYMTQLGREGDRDKVTGCYDTTGGEPQIKGFKNKKYLLEKKLWTEGY